MPATAAPDQAKRELFLAWLHAHAPGHAAPLLATLAPDYLPTAAAEQLLKQGAPGEMHLYVLCAGDPTGEPVPRYVGKSVDPWKRWADGHLRQLRAAARGGGSPSYTAWVDAIAGADGPPWLVCVAQSGVQFPPIPGFPTTIGSIEYQLVGLATDAFPGQLLNHEGAAR